MWKRMLGETRISDRAADDLLSAALDLGVTFFDTARSYGASEERIGRWLAASSSRRERVVVSTKGGYGVEGVEDWTAECVRRGIDDALQRLRMDAIDVFFLHSCPRDVLQRGDLLGTPERCRLDRPGMELNARRRGPSSRASSPFRRRSDTDARRDRG